MTHDELLAKIEEPCGYHTPAETKCPECLPLFALRAVVELHKEVKLITAISSDKDFQLSTQVCEVCSRFAKEPISYPCFTIQAIEKELG